MDNTTTRFVPQYEYIGGTASAPAKFWNETQTYTTENAARIEMEVVKRRNEARPSKFITGNYRVIKRVTVTTETVCD